MNPIDPFIRNTRIAYFSMEIAVSPEIHTYSGGLGVLAGDIAQTCGDLELPVVFVSLISRAGHFHQTIDEFGRQHEQEDRWDPKRWAVPLSAMVALRLEGRDVWVRPWLYINPGTRGHEIPVLFLDTDLEENHTEDRTLTHYLYGGDSTYRLKQELVLGVGGVRLLRALGFTISRYHLNEGHAAFLAVELLHGLPQSMNASNDLYNSVRVRNRCIFTTHTPVEAAHDRFSYDLVARVVGDTFDLSGLKHLAGNENLNMTQLALNSSGYVNGVALKHAQTAGRMFPNIAVRAITNGIHVGRWTHEAFVRLYDQAIPSWAQEPELLTRADQLSNAMVWDAHTLAKRELVEKVRQTTGVVLSPDKPIIGFARRMTGYKRPDMLFGNLERLRTIARDFPFQIVVSGKAHPQDLEGKRLIERINGAMRSLAGSIPCAYLPNYDLRVAKMLVAGVDIWLNTPQPPLEASGTSGMKAALNGVLNLSILDGWWIEAWIEGVTGWAIEDRNQESDSDPLYNKLQRTVLPLYYNDRDRWIWMMKQAISKIASYFNSHRMMRRYASEAYLR